MSVSNTAKQRKNTVVINPNLIRIHYFITYVIETKVTKKLEWFQIGKALPGFYATRMCLQVETQQIIRLLYEHLE